MRALLVFCEGNHDIVFAKRSLGALAGATHLSKTIEELPFPIGSFRSKGGDAGTSLIVTQLGKRTLSSTNFKAVTHAPLPNFEEVLHAPTSNTLFVIIRSSGDSAASAAMALLSDFKFLFDLIPDAEITEFASAFLFDADDAGLAARETTFAQTYSAILPSTAPAHGKWVMGKVDNRDFPVGLYVFHDPQTKQGTLEDALSKMVAAASPQRWQAAGQYLATHSPSDAPVTLHPAKSKKAQICITGQFASPGSPMTQAIERAGLAQTHFANSTESQALATFLSTVPW